MPTGGSSIPAAFLQEETFPWPFRKLEDVVLGVELGEGADFGAGVAESHEPRAALRGS